MAVSSPIAIDRQRVEELTSEELARLNERTARSSAMFERARTSLSGGVASSYQLRDPWPIYLASGEEVSRPAGDPSQTRSRVAEALRGIAAREFAPQPGEHCRWCDFLSFCDAGRAYVGAD